MQYWILTHVYFNTSVHVGTCEMNRHIILIIGLNEIKHRPPR